MQTGLKHTNTPTRCDHIRRMKWKVAAGEICCLTCVLLRRRCYIGGSQTPVCRPFDVSEHTQAIFLYFSCVSFRSGPNSPAAFFYLVVSPSGSRQEPNRKWFFFSFCCFLFCLVIRWKVFMQRCSVQIEWVANPVPSRLGLSSAF